MVIIDIQYTENCKVEDLPTSSSIPLVKAAVVKHAFRALKNRKLPNEADWTFTSL